MSRWIFLALFILAVIIYIYYGNFYSDSYKRKIAKKKQFLSNGTFDVHARSSLETISSIKKKNSSDLFNRGYILENNVEKISDKPLTSISSLIRKNYLSSAKLMDNEINEVNGNDNNNFELNDYDFMIDHIINYEIEQNNVNANNEERRVNANNAERRVNAINNTVVGINAINNEERRVNTMRGNTLLLTNIQNKIIDRKINNAKKTDNPLKSLITWTNDPQSAHDSSVNIDLKDIYEKIKLSESISITKIQEDIYKIPLAEKNKDKIQRVLEIIKNNNYISSINTGEKDIFTAVWKRAEAPGNPTENMREALVYAMIDCVNESGVVCINGRCARYLSSMNAIDRELGDVKTSNVYRNEILENSARILSNEIESAKKSEDMGEREVGLSYTNGNDPNPIELNKFKTRVKSLFDDMLRGYEDKLSENSLSVIKKEIYAGVD